MNIVKELRERSGLQQKELAIEIGVAQPTISEWEHGKKDPTGDRLKKVAEFFGVSVGIVRGYEPIPPLKRYTEGDAIQIPVLGTIPAGIPIEAIEDIIDWEEIPADWGRGEKQYFGLKVKGASMYPEYREGDIVIFRKQETAETGQDVAVIIGDENATFKRFRKTDEGVLLQSINPDCPSYPYTNQQVKDLRIRIIGVAVEQRRRR